MSDLILSASGVRKRFDGRDILKGVSLSLQKGDVVAIIGRSGSGKSTFLRCLAELERIDAGRIEIGGEAMVDTEKKGYEPESRLRVIRRRMGYVFQDFNLFPHFTVLRNITEAQRCVLGRSRKEAEQRARALLTRMGLSNKADTYPCFLSGGPAAARGPSPGRWRWIPISCALTSRPARWIPSLRRRCSPSSEIWRRRGIR